MKHQYENLDRLIYILTGALLTVIFELASRSGINAGSGMWHGLNFNLLVYVLALVAAFAVFCVLSMLIERLRRKRAGAANAAPGKAAARMQSAVLYGFYTIVASSLVVLIFRIYLNEGNLYAGSAASTYLRQEVPHRLYLIAIATIAASLFFTLPRLTRTYAPDRPFRVTTALIWAVFNGIIVYCPNIFEDKGGGLYHVHAVTNSIVNVASSQPYSAYNCSVYGHYGLICLPFVKFLGGDLYAVMQTLSLMAFFAFLAAFYVADKLIRHDVVFLMTIAGITGTTTILTRHGQYFQINPLRLLFPCLALAIIAFGASHRTKKAHVLTIVLAVLCGIGAVIWNLETGFFCLLIFTMTFVLRGLSEDRLFSSATLRRVITAVICGIGCIAASYGIVCLYNTLSGGSAGSFRLFLYPYFSGTYHVNHLRVPLPSTAFLYFFQILLFFLTLIVTFRREYLIREGVITGDPDAAWGVDFGAIEARDRLRAAVSLSGLLALTYFLNRSAYGNISISYIQMCLLLASLGEDALTLSKTNRRQLLGTPASYLHYIISVVLFGGCVWLAIEGAMYLPVALDIRANSSWKTTSMNQGIEAIRASIPMDTYAFGTGVPEVYLQLGWKTGCTVTDWSDMNEKNHTAAFEGAMKHNRVLTTDVEEFTEYSKGIYAPTTNVVIDGTTFQLFERIDPIDENAVAAGDLTGAAEGTLIPEGNDEASSSAESSADSAAFPSAESVLTTSSGTESALSSASGAESVLPSSEKKQNDKKTSENASGSQKKETGSSSGKSGQSASSSSSEHSSRNKVTATLTPLPFGKNGASA